jgi:DNA repair exonuclease SbcCD ATPase subunit
VTAYPFKHRNVQYSIIDTPGFNDTHRTDEEILEEIVSWLSSQHKERNMLSGIIYLHPISNTRVQGSTMTQLRVFKELCGKDYFDNVTIATTFWSVTDRAEAERREVELFSTANFLGDMKGLGASTARISDDRETPLRLIEQIASNRPNVMKVQKELDDSGATFKTTQASKTLSRELAMMHNDFTAKIAALTHVSWKQKISNEFRQRKGERAEEAECKKQNEIFKKNEERNRLENARLAKIHERTKREQEERARMARQEERRKALEHEMKLAQLERQRLAREKAAQEWALRLQKEREEEERAEARRRAAERERERAEERARKAAKAEQDR